MRIAEKEPANKDPPLTTVEDPVVQANRFNDFYVSVKVAASAKAKALCHHNGFSVESVELVVPAADDLKNRNKLSFMLWRNRTLKRLSSIFHQTKRPGLIEYPLECLKTVYQSPCPLLPIWLLLRSHPIALHRCGSPQWSSQTSNPAI